ncbi:hypothetical protein JCM1840_004454 [Sporobolomyces johnsonii]
MGLASKLAAANANSAPAGGAPPPSASSGGYGQPLPQPPQQQSQYGAPPAYSSGPGYAPPQGGKSQYAPPSGPPPPIAGNRPQSGGYAPPSGPPPPVGGGNWGQPPQQQYGTPQQQYGAPQQQYSAPQQQYGAPQQHYGAPQPPPRHQPQQGGGAASDPNVILGLFKSTVVDQNIQAFYPDPRQLEPLAHRIASSGALQRVAQEWRMPLEIAMDLAKLALFDVVLYCDDSGSMAFEEGGSRIDDLKLIVSRVAYAASLFDDDGIEVRFMNSRVEGNGLRTEQEAMALVQQVKFSGLTPLGTALNNKVIEPLILGPARANRLKKPVLIIAVTDGVPGGEDRYQIVKVITNAVRTLASTRYGADAISLQLAQVGNDMKARAFLEEIDVHPEVGPMVDTTSNFEQEADDMSKANPPVDLTPELWLVKVSHRTPAPIDSSYDTADEK